MLVSSNAATTGSCGSGLATQDLSGVCRMVPTTPGALEAIGPSLPAPSGGSIQVVPKGGGVQVR